MSITSTKRTSPIKTQPTRPTVRRIQALHSAEVSEHYVALANRVIALRLKAGDHKSIGVASCLAGEGATTVSTNLAVAMAQAAPRGVLLVRSQPARHSMFRNHIDVQPGWYDFVSGQEDLETVVLESTVPGLSIMAPGDHTGLDAQPIDPSRMAKVISRIKERFEFVIFDLPHANELTECFPLAALMDGVVLVVEANRVAAPQVKRAHAELAQAGAHTVGVVLNKKRSYVPAILRRLLRF